MTYFEPILETMPRKELDVLRLERLQSTLNRAYLNVAHYRRAFDSVNILPEDIRSIDDLESLPFTTRDDVEANYPYDMFAVPLREVVRMHSPSAKSSKPVVTGYTKNDLVHWAKLVARYMVAAGVTKDDVVQVAFRYGLLSGGFGMHAAAELVGASVIPTGVGNTAEQIMIMQDYLTTVLVCTPRYALVIMDGMKQKQVNPKALRLRIGVMGGEPLSHELRQEIESGLGIEVFDNYGSSVVIGPGIAGECQAHQGLHVYEDYFIAEVIDPYSLKRLEPGERGELVITTLAREAYPLIRYRTGDITSVMKDKCPCGRTHMRLSGFYGRVDNSFKVKGVMVSPNRIEEILAEQGIDTKFQARVYTSGAREIIEVLLEVKEGLFFDEMRAQETFIERIERAMHAGLGVRVKVRIVPAKAFVGKGVVVDERL